MNDELKSTREEVQEQFLNYLKVYFSERNMKSLSKFFSENISGFGTGIDETAYSYEESYKLYERDINQVPNPVYYEIIKTHINIPSNNIGIVDSELKIEFNIFNQVTKINNLRLSIVFFKKDQEWLIENMHISLPTSAHECDESYPIKELEDRNIVLQKLVDDKTRKLNEVIDQISKMATTDSMTGLFNRFKIEKIIDAEIIRSNRYNNIFSVIMMDIDHFKRVNDEYGHMVGDQILVEFANILSQRVRNADVFGRWGGEEFIFVCPETEKEEARVLAEDLREMIEAHPFDTIGKKTASFGIASYKSGDTMDTILGRTDRALYQAKKGGRNMVCIC